MTDCNKFILHEFREKNKKIGYVPSILETSSIWKFRYICYKFNYFLKHIPLPKISKNKIYEAVFIDFRILPHIEFLIRNTILKLGSSWSYTIICGIDNYEYICDIVNNINKNIKIIKLEYNNLSQGEYSNLLTTKNFWDKLYGEQILIYQEDSLIFNKNIKPFLKYDFIGAPFGKDKNDTPNCVGNGGFSLRTKCKMLEVIKNCKLEDLNVNSSTQNFMDMTKLEYPPEDVYFSKNMQEYKIGDVSDWNSAYKFSSEQVFNPNSFGGHKFWISNKNWQQFLTKIFNYKQYIAKSDLNKFLKYKELPQDFNKNKEIKNAYDIDIEFFCKVNNIKYINDKLTLKYINDISLDGFIYHPKQLFNIFSDFSIYKFLNNIYISKNNTIIPIQNFVNKYLYNSSFDYLSELLIKKKYDTLNNNYDIILLVFIGNEDLGIDLLKRIIDYKKINIEFNIAFCINNTIKNTQKIKTIIKNNFDFYAIYYSKEFGTDITPTLLMYNDILKNHRDIKHILKFHTKSISSLYNTLTDYLLKTPIEKIISSKQTMCNCVGPVETYIKLSDDIFNDKLKKEYSNAININNYFIGGTIFYTENHVFNKVVDFVKNNNYRSFLLNTLYENNTINQTCSPIHFLERLFGVIKV